MKNLFLATVAALALGTAANAADAVLGWGGIGSAQATSGTIQQSAVGSQSALIGVSAAHTDGAAVGQASASGFGVGGTTIGLGGGAAGAQSSHSGANQQNASSGAFGFATGAAAGTTLQENSGIGTGIGFGGFGVVLP